MNPNHFNAQCPSINVQSNSQLSGTQDIHKL
jgi:hypothetical protein